MPRGKAKEKDSFRQMFRNLEKSKNNTEGQNQALCDLSISFFNEELVLRQPDGF